jgi:alpha-ribazole phosphatase
MRLYLVRHPPPELVPGLCYGASDVPCDAQVLAKAAAQLHEVLPKGLPILSSPLQRCERLAQCLCGLQANLAYKTDAALAEMNFGDWELMLWANIERLELDAWTRSFATYRCGGAGESAGQLVGRVLQRLLESAQSGEDQIWITHAGVMRALQWLAGQPWANVTAVWALQWERSGLLSADWPKSELAFAQVHRWDWPQAWPHPRELARAR